MQQYFSWNWLHRFTVYALSLRGFASAVDDEFQSHPAVEHVKSVRHGTFPLWIAWLLVLFLRVPGTWAHPSHGMPDAEVRTTSLPTISPFHAPTCSKPGKRAYHRACKRAFLQGGAMYRGRWHMEATLNARRVTGSCSPHAKPRAPAAKSRHLRVLTWNIGGMGGGVYDSFLEFASTLNYDIILLQETKMQFTNTWTDAKWHFIHSGAKHAGVLIMISRAITSQNSIRFQCLEEGRLLEARFALHECSRFSISTSMPGVMQQGSSPSGITYGLLCPRLLAIHQYGIVSLWQVTSMRHALRKQDYAALGCCVRRIIKPRM